MSEQKIKVKELNDKADSLCDYCSQNYPDCTSRIRFGVGLGYDNIVGCTSFDEDVLDTHITENEYTREEFESIYED